MNISHGDPILRARLEEQQKNDLGLGRRYWMDPSTSVTVTRQSKSELFQKNVVKHVKKNPEPRITDLKQLWPKKVYQRRKKKSEQTNAMQSKCIRL